MPTRRSYRRRRLLRRRSRRRNPYGVSAVRRPSYLLRASAGNGRIGMRVRRGGKAYPRTVGRGMSAKFYKFSDTAFDCWGSNADPSQLAVTTNVFRQFAPVSAAPVGASVFQLFEIEGGGTRELHRRATDRIILKRLDLKLEFTLGEAAQSGSGRLTLLWDRSPNLMLTSPAWTDIFEGQPAYPPVPNTENVMLSGYSARIDVNPTIKTDLLSYLKPDQRNRFEILYQQTVHLERGAVVHTIDRSGATFAPGTWYHYAGGALSQTQQQKSLFVNRVVTYEENSSGTGSGLWNEIVSGCIWVCWQSTNCRYPAETVGDPPTVLLALDTEVRLNLQCRAFFVDLG